MDVATQKRIDSLDILRGIAVLCVMAFHFFDRAFPINVIGQLDLNPFRLGWAGVDLFFVLSGFLITGILLDHKNDPHYFRNFYARRILRIFPLYYLSLFSLFVVLPLCFPEGPEFLGNPYQWLISKQEYFWTFLSNFLVMVEDRWFPFGTSHLWSLAIEEQFYLLWPFVVLLLSRKKLMYFCVFLVVVATLLRWFLWAQEARSFVIYVLTPTRMDTLAVGAILALLMRSPGGFKKPQYLWRRGFWSAVVGLCLIYLIQGNFHATSPGMLLFGYSFLILMSASVIIGALTWDAKSLPLSRPLCKIGKYSYGLYVVHFPILGIFWKLLPLPSPDNFEAKILVATACFLIWSGICYFIARLSWVCIEKPFLNLKRYFDYDNSVVDKRANLPIEPQSAKEAA